jgi:hypothetical protein
MSEEQRMREEYEERGNLMDSESSAYDSEVGCGRYLSVFLGIAVVFILASVWRYYALMGTFSGREGSLLIENYAEVELDTGAIESASQKLRENFNMNIAIFIFQSMNDATGMDMSSLYNSYRNFVALREFSELPPNNLYIVVGIDEQYSEISWGANLMRLDGDRIREEVMNPRLFEGDYTGAITRSFDATVERFTNGELAFQEMMSGYGEYIDEAFIVGIILVVIYVAWHFQSQGVFEGAGEGSWTSAGGGSWRSSGSSFRSSSGGSRSSGSSGRSGGSSRGSWKN